MSDNLQRINQDDATSEPSTARRGVEEEVLHWRQRGQYRELNGHKIFTMDEGDLDQPVIVLIHGFPTCSWDWLPLWQDLRQNFRLISLDMLGFGLSEKPDRRNYTIHGQADLFESLLAELGIKKYHILAHDYGDTVAQELLARQLEGKGVGQWLSGCFLNGGLFPETHRALLTQKLLLSPLGALVNSFNGFGKFSKNFSHVFGPKTKPSEWELQVFWRFINENNGKHLFHNLITYMRDRKQHRQRWVEALQNATMPLAVINGSKDPVSGSHMVARYQQLECRLDYLGEMAEIGHYPQVEAPDLVLTHYRNFLTQISAV
ncbi:MAG: alpha/beta hydrolase [Candidatus Pelagadaptatus aseana]|uniref:alpha/beta fold hydrolase n=1 Tax=Candidatus Pelagadaptatus aseana TaxID=3120508 RepID=UPI0039B35EE1